MSILRKSSLNVASALLVTLAMLACSSNQKTVGQANGTDGSAAQGVDAVGPAPVASNARQVAVEGLSGVTAIAAGWFHVCAISVDGSVKCWGSNDHGQLGDGTSNDSETPVAVGNVSGAIAITAGAQHTCVVLSDGTAQCWGDNTSGELGLGYTTTDWRSPVAVPGLSGAVSITAGVFHTCALLSGGEIRCWGGDNLEGERGNPVMGKSTPVPVDGISGAIAVSAGRVHTCAAISDGTVQCWGSNDNGQLGNGSSDNGYSRSHPTPAEVGGITDATSVAAGSDHTCALVANGEVRCWGNNRAGDLGNGSTDDSYTPVAVSGLAGATMIAAGDGQTCALLSDGTVTCWGTRSLTPVPVDGISDAIAVTMGSGFGCAVLSDKTVRCFGGYSW
jgi:alpha-tubulin suppressor-like RCC1 family protein